MKAEKLKEAPSILHLTVQIASAYFSHDHIPGAKIADVLSDTYEKLSELKFAKPKPATPIPAVPIDQSVHDDYIVCLEDGLKRKTLRRHLTVLGITPEDYRKKWGLPYDYPLTAKTFSADRSALAKRTNFGRARATLAANKPSSDKRV